jgi:tRNA(Ser,Leu) C12 N-acetylase TAN1
MYEHKLAPNTNIVNVIIYCPQKEMQKLKSDFESKEYPVPIEYVLQDKLDELKKAIDDFT